ncbi:Peptidyl-prolyl cis-trans isomerase FKBP15-2 [Hibiscus syriacus]|uniref:peptidylprolyl isomerase n=1 Tax=Hibiscus syriacus TaxID=106335 RepID=A0A6A2Y3D3_HIBSY|nr:Peptidyl-prolyl cis-trans isomerase FKBP15-2 [Hibiscus syriacus]
MNISCALKLKVSPIVLLLVLFSLANAKKSGVVTELQIGVKGKLIDGTNFYSSFERGDPVEFELGSGQVIKGWDQGLLGMCVKLKIPAKLGYGEQGSPPTIPGGATLIFETELVSVNGKPSSGGDTTDDEL